MRLGRLAGSQTANPFENCRARRGAFAPDKSPGLRLLPGGETGPLTAWARLLRLSGTLLSGDKSQ